MLDRKDLIYLNNIIVDRLKLLSQISSTENMAKFHVSQRISFTTPDGTQKNGRIIKLNKKTVSIITDVDEQWNVEPGFLKSI